MKVCSMIAFAGGLVVGGMVGGAVALMFGPKKGEDLRRDIKEKLAEAKKGFTEHATVCHEGYCKREELTE